MSPETLTAIRERVDAGGFTEYAAADRAVLLSHVDEQERAHRYARRKLIARVEEQAAEIERLTERLKRCQDKRNIAEEAWAAVEADVGCPCVGTPDQEDCPHA